MTLRNTAPPGGLPGYIIGSAVKPPLPTGTSRLYVSIYTPWNLVSAATDGAPAAFQSEVERGRHVHSTFLDVPPQGEIEIALDLTGTLTEPSECVLDLHAQPVVKPGKIVTTTTWGGQQTQTKRLVLGSDERLRFQKR